jgi:hypothetical protein
MPQASYQVLSRAVTCCRMLSRPDRDTCSAYTLVVGIHSHGAGSNQYPERKRCLEDYRLRQWFYYLGSQWIARSQ